jgi:hypothetical protein
MLRSVDWQLITYVSAQSIDPIFKDQAVQDGTDALSRNDANQILIFLACLNLEDWIGCTETSVTTNRHCVTSQEIKDLIYTAVKARNNTWTALLSCKKDWFCYSIAVRYMYVLGTSFTALHYMYNSLSYNVLCLSVRYSFNREFNQITRFFY